MYIYIYVHTQIYKYTDIHIDSSIDRQIDK